MSIIERMELSLDEEAEPPEIGDFGFYHDDDDVFDVCHMLIASNFHVLPESGGWLDQDEAWAHDIQRWLGIRARLRWERQQDEKDEKFMESLIGDGDSMDVGAMFGG